MVYVRRGTCGRRALLSRFERQLLLAAFLADGARGFHGADFLSCCVIKGLQALRNFVSLACCHQQVPSTSLDVKPVCLVRFGPHY